MNYTNKDFRIRLLERRFGTKPNGWKIIKLGHLIEERKEESSDLNSYPLYSFTIENGVTPKTARYYREYLLKDREANKYKLVYNGDLIYNPMNLRFGAISISRVPFPVSVSAYYNILKINNELCNESFLEAFLKCYEMIDLYDRVAIGSLIEKRRVHLSEFKKINIYLPPPDEQKRIGEIIDLWDSNIAILENSIELKRQFKKSLMQQLLTGKKRFKEFQGQEWREVKLGKIFKERRETNYPELPLLSITAEKGVIFRDELEKKDTSNSDKTKYKRIVPGDIGYNTMRMWQGNSGVSNLEGIVSPAYTICTPIEGVVDVGFAGYLFKYPPMIHLFYRFSQGLVNDTLNLKFKNFAQIKVKIPPISEQRKIAKILEYCDQDIQQICQIKKARLLQKKGLIQKLLTGKVKV